MHARGRSRRARSCAPSSASSGRRCQLANSADSSAQPWMCSPALGFDFIVRPLGLARRRIELDCLLARPLARARVGTRALAAYRQPLAVPHAAPGPEVHQALDVHRPLAAQVALDRPLRELGADRTDLGVGKILDLGGRRDARAREDLERPGTADAEDVREPDAHVLVHRNVDAGDACHDAVSSTLALFVARVGADHIDHAAAPHDLAVLADFLDGRTYFHRTPTLLLVTAASPGRSCRAPRPADWPSSSGPDSGATSGGPAAGP